MSYRSFARLGERGGDARERILADIRACRPEAAPLPLIEGVSNVEGNLVARFTSAVESAAGALWRVGDGGVVAAVASAYPNAGVVAAANPRGEGWDLDDVADHDAERVDVLVCRGVCAVAENGAVWLAESHMGHRAAPYLAQHLVLVIDEGAIVADMHAAYARIDVDAEGFGAFIAGPSKTADIEQSLVIGAHGPRSLTVLLEG